MENNGCRCDVIQAVIKTGLANQHKFAPPAKTPSQPVIKHIKPDPK